MQKLQKPKEEEIDFRAHLKQSTNKVAVKDEYDDKVNLREEIQLKATKGRHRHEEE